MSAIPYAMNRSDEVRFNSLMRSSYRKVYSMAYRLAGDRADAEDLTQEAFYRAYRSFSDFEGDRPFENWIYRIVTRLFLDLLRTKRRRVNVVSYDAPLTQDHSDNSIQFEVADASANPEQTLLGKCLSPDMADALTGLSPDQLMLLQLADVEKVPYQEIAQRLGKPIGTVRSRLHRVHRLLRKRLEAAREREARKPALNLCTSA